MSKKRKRRREKAILFSILYNYITIEISDNTNLHLIVVLSNIGDIIAYGHGLHFCCQEVYLYRNQKKV